MSKPSSRTFNAALPSQLAYASFFFSYYGYIGIIMPFLSLYLVYRGFNVLEMASLMSVLQFTRIFGPFMWGWLADRWHARVLALRISAISALLVFAGLPWLNGFALVFIWLVILNTLTSAQTPLGDAVVVEALTHQAQGKPSGFDIYYGRLRAFGSFGFVCAVLVGGYLTQRYGITLFPALCLVLLCMLCISVFAFHENYHSSTRLKPERGALLRILGLREVQWFFAVAFFMVAAHATLYTFYSLYLDKLGYGKFAIGMMWTLGVLAEIVFFWFQNAFFSRFSLRSLMLCACAAAVLRFAVIGVLPSLWEGTAWYTLVMLVLMQVLHAFTFGVQHSASLKLLQRWFAGPLQASGQALYTSIAYGLGGTLGGLLSGWVWTEWGAGAAFYTSSLAALLGSFAVWRCFAVQVSSKNVQ